MARINIEDEFFDDAATVGARMQSVDLAMGQALRLIRWAQSQTKQNKATTHEEFKRKGFSEHLFPEFATLDGDKVKVRGADAHFAWLEKKRAAGSVGGKKSGVTRSSKMKQNKARASKIKLIEPSSSSSSSSSSSEEFNTYSNQEVKELARLFVETFPGTTIGSNAETRFSDQIKTEKQRQELRQAILHYKENLDFANKDTVWKSAKTTFGNFLGTKRSGYYWRDFIESSNVPALVRPAGSMRGE